MIQKRFENGQATVLKCLEVSSYQYLALPSYISIFSYPFKWIDIQLFIHINILAILLNRSIFSSSYISIFSSPFKWIKILLFIFLFIYLQFSSSFVSTYSSKNIYQYLFQLLHTDQYLALHTSYESISSYLSITIGGSSSANSNRDRLCQFASFSSIPQHTIWTSSWSVNPDLTTLPQMNCCFVLSFSLVSPLSSLQQQQKQQPPPLPPMKQQHTREHLMQSGILSLSGDVSSSVSRA